MRVLSFIPAFLLAAASFVAAAPASVPDTTCVSNPTGGNGNDAPVQPVIAIITSATNNMQPLSDKLSGLQGGSCTPGDVHGVVVEITAVVSDCVARLNAVAKIDLTGLDLKGLYSAIYVHLTLIVTVLQTLVTVVVSLKTAAVGEVQTSICALLDVIVQLVGCLQVYVVASIVVVLGPVLVFVDGSVGLLKTILVNLNVVLGVN